MEWANLGTVKGNWRLIVLCGLSPRQEQLFIRQFEGMAISRIGGVAGIKSRLHVIQGLHNRESWFTPKLLIKMHAERFKLSKKHISCYSVILPATEDEDRLLEAKRKFRKSSTNRILPHQIHSADSESDSEFALVLLSRHEPNLFRNKLRFPGGRDDKYLSKVSGLWHLISIGLGIAFLIHATLWKGVNLLPNVPTRVFFWRLLTADLSLTSRALSMSCQRRRKFDD